MAENITLAKPLKLATPGTAPIDGLTVATVKDIANIESPWNGMMVYCAADGKTYRVTKLKDVSTGVFTKKAVDTYEAVPDAKDMAEKADKTALDGKADATSLDGKADKSDLNAKADKNHTHAIANVTGLDTALNGKADKEHTHEQYALKTEIPDGAQAATISLPVPYDDDNDNVSLYLDIGTDPEFAENTYTRIRMTDHYAKMKIFANETFRTMTEGFCGVPEYGATVSFTLDTEMMPGYVPGTVYYARYTWMDSKGAHDGWHGFIFSGDVADMEPIRTLYENPPKVKAESAAEGTLSLDYLEGEIQNYTMNTNVTVDLANVANVPFGEALICNIKRTGGTLSVVNGNSTQTYTESKTYMIVTTNFGTPMIAVTETI